MSQKQAMLHPHERLDDLQLNGLFLIQDPKRFCFGIDAVCLSDFVTVHKNETVIDLCTGTGIIPILLSAKTKGRHFTGLELQPESADMARRSVSLNGLETRVRIDCGDIKQAPERYGAGAFDVVTVNPPYLTGGIVNQNAALAAAKHELYCTLEDVVRVSARIVKTEGRLYMVHRPHRLTDVFCTLRAYRLEPKTLRMVQASGKPPSLVMVEARLYGRPHLTVIPPLVLGIVQN